MTEARLFKHFAYALVFLLLCSLVVLVKLLPLDAQRDGLPAPDLVFALVFAWILRRPDLLPLGLIVLVVFAEDLLLMQPPGLWTAIVVLVTEALRRRHKRLRTLSLTGEIGLFVGVLTAAIGLNWLILALTFADQPGLGAQLLRMPVTVAVYPLVLLLCTGALGLRRRTVAEGFDRRMRR